MHKAGVMPFFWTAQHGRQICKSTGSRLPNPSTVHGIWPQGTSPNITLVAQLQHWQTSLLLPRSLGKIKKQAPKKETQAAPTHPAAPPPNIRTQNIASSRSSLHMNHTHHSCTAQSKPPCTRVAMPHGTSCNTQAAHSPTEKSLPQHSTPCNCPCGSPTAPAQHACSSKMHRTLFTQLG